MDFPNKRLEVTGVGNPIYISDIAVANQNVLDAMKSILGVGASDFWIISGMDYNPGVTGSYST